MASQIGALVVHGTGIQAPDFADDFIAEVNDCLDSLGVAPNTSPSRSWMTGASRARK